MFDFATTPVMVVGLLVLFGWCTGWSVRETAVPQSTAHRVSNGLHLLMSVVMLLMVSPLTWRPLVLAVPLPVWVALFFVASAWFVVQGVRHRGNPGEARHFAAHSLMFLAMVWHLGGMMVRAAAAWMTPGTGKHNPDRMVEAGLTPVAMVVAGIGVPFMIYLLTATVIALARAVRPVGASLQPVMDAGGCHEARPVGGVTDRLAALSEAAMVFGMFWMSIGLVTPLVPVLSVLRV